MGEELTGEALTHALLTRIHQTLERLESVMTMGVKLAGEQAVASAFERLAMELGRDSVLVQPKHDTGCSCPMCAHQKYTGLYMAFETARSAYGRDSAEATTAHKACVEYANLHGIKLGDGQ